jgi:hypothetical protein
MKRFEKDPFSLMTFHRVLIGTAVAGALFYGVWEIIRNSGNDPAGAIIRASVSWLLAAVACWYLWRIRRK